MLRLCSIVAALVCVSLAQDTYKPACQCNTFDACVRSKYARYEECALKTCVRENMDEMHTNWMACWNDMPNIEKSFTECIHQRVGKKCINRAKRNANYANAYYTNPQYLQARGNQYQYPQQQQQQAQQATSNVNAAYAQFATQNQNNQYQYATQYAQNNANAYTGYEQNNNAYEQQNSGMPKYNYEQDKYGLDMENMMEEMQSYFKQWTGYGECIDRCMNQTDAFNSYRGGKPEKRLSVFTACAKELDCVMNAAEWGDVSEAAKTCTVTLQIDWRQQAERHCKCIEAASLQRQRDTHPPCELIMSYIDMIDDSTLNEIIANVAAFFDVEHQIII